MTTEQVKGKALVKVPDYEHDQAAAAATWIIDHNLSAIGLIAQFFDTDDRQIIPETFTLTTPDQCTATFSEGASGYALIDYVEREWTYASMMSDVAYWKVGTGTTSGYNAAVNNDLETVASEGSTLIEYNDSTYYYVDFDVPNTLTDLDITEMGLFDSNLNLLFYTRCSILHKPYDMSLTVHYKIEQTG